jgi:TetR/AcrR family transcriptional repressor of bet genes
MPSAVARPVSKKRTAPKEARQLQLIKATIRSIAKHGLSTTTMATVSSEARLSQGIINLHFQSKDRLLVETLRYVADEYKSAWEKAFEQSGDSPEEKISALLAVDFDKSICQRNKLAVWFAFWGESKSRPTYRNICRKRDREYFRAMIEQCRALITQGGYQGLDAEIVANGLQAMTSGLWLDLLMSPDHMTPGQGRAVCLLYLQSVFPRHFKRSRASRSRT